MKVIKLNRRYKLHKEHGYQVGLKFDCWDAEARAVEKICKEMFDRKAWWNPEESDWYEYFGKRVVFGSTPYFIMLRKESHLSMVMLKYTVDQNS